MKSRRLQSIREPISAFVLQEERLFLVNKLTVEYHWMESLHKDWFCNFQGKALTKNLLNCWFSLWYKSWWHCPTIHILTESPCPRLGSHLPMATGNFSYRFWKESIHKGSTVVFCYGGIMEPNFFKSFCTLNVFASKSSPPLFFIFSQMLPRGMWYRKSLLELSWQ